MKPTIGIMLGDATGIGPELIAKVCSTGAGKDMCTCVIMGSRSVMEQGMAIAGKSFPLHIIKDLSEASDPAEGYDFLEVPGLDASDYKLGEVNAVTGGYAVKLQMLGLDFCQAGRLDGFMYAPLNKAAFKKAGHNYNDGMRMLAAYLKFDKPYGEINIVDGLWTTRVTSHVPMADICKYITKEKIVEVIGLANKSIRMDIAEPRLAVAGLNPHNGESGTCGREEIDIIRPAVEEAQAQGINVDGPFSADTLFPRAFSGAFDMVITMYHDQGQIAMKLKDFANIVTLVGGFDYPLATPAHGTAFDIVGKGKANPNPTLRALQLVCRMATRRRQMRETGK